MSLFKKILVLLMCLMAFNAFAEGEGEGEAVEPDSGDQIGIKPDDPAEPSEPPATTTDEPSDPIGPKQDDPSAGGSEEPAPTE